MWAVSSSTRWSFATFYILQVLTLEFLITSVLSSLWLDSFQEFELSFDLFYLSCCSGSWLTCRLMLQSLNKWTISLFFRFYVVHSYIEEEDVQVSIWAVCLDTHDTHYSVYSVCLHCSQYFWRDFLVTLLSKWFIVRFTNPWVGLHLFCFTNHYSLTVIM